MLQEDMQARVEDIVRRLAWTGPIYTISAVDGAGTQQLCFDVMQYLNKIDEY